MMRLHVLLCGTFLLVEFTEVCVSSSFFSKIPGYKLSTSDYMPSFTDRTAQVCTHECLLSDSVGQTCSMVNYNNVTKECQLYLGDASPLGSTNNVFIPASDWDIYHKKALMDTYWTRYYDRDDPSGLADNEQLYRLRDEGIDMCRGQTPRAASCKTGSTTFNSMNKAGLNDVLNGAYDCSPSHGLRCLNEDQVDGTCDDYSISFSCVTVKNYLDSLLGYWPFDSDLKDVSGNGYDGSSVSGAGVSTAAYAKGGGSLSVNNGDYVKVDGLANHVWGTSVSISVWFKRTGLDGVYSTVIGNGWWTEGSFDIRCQSDEICGSTVMTSTDLNGWEFRASAVLNIWHHAVISYDGASGTNAFYLNGESISESGGGYATRDSGAPQAVSKPLYFGYNTYSTPETFRGYIDEARIYNRVLDEQDVAWLYSQGGGSV